jgi:hypothetical protein
MPVISRKITRNPLQEKLEENYDFGRSHKNPPSYTFGSIRTLRRHMRLGAQEGEENTITKKGKQWLGRK